MVKAYCMRCKEMKEMKNEHTVTKNGRKMIKGVCSKCGTKMNKFI